MQKLKQWDKFWPWFSAYTAFSNRPLVLSKGLYKLRLLVKVIVTKVELLSAENVTLSISHASSIELSVIDTSDIERPTLRMYSIFFCGERKHSF